MINYFMVKKIKKSSMMLIDFILLITFMEDFNILHIVCYCPDILFILTDF